MSYQHSGFTCQRDSLSIRGYEYLPRVRDMNGKHFPAVIISHGFTGNHRETDPYGKYFAKKGYAAYTFDFCGGGPRSESDGAMEHMTVRSEIDDLKAVVSYVSSLPYINPEKITLMGCSQGGFVSALTAGSIPDKIARLILFYPAISLADDARMGQLMQISYDPADPPEVISLRKMKVGRAYPLEAQALHEYADLIPFEGPVLIVHGTADPVVNVAYSKQAWLTYTTGSVPAQVERESLGSENDVPFLPDLPEGTIPRPGRQLMLISGGSHGFLLNRKHHSKSLFAVEEFLKGYTEVLTIDVQLTDMIRETRGLHTHLELPFTGTAKSPWFSGEIQEGAKDTQELTGLHTDSKCADYVIRGCDYTGAPCQVHVINRGSGAQWKPTVTTDSKALSFLNGADCDALLKDRKCGPLVRIYAHVKLQH